MSRNVTVQSMDLGYQDAITALLGIDGSGVEVGIFSEAGVYQNGRPVAQVATDNEYGTEHIPARPFMGKTYADNQDRFADTAGKVMGAAISGRLTVDSALQVIGVEQATAVKSSINDWTDPPNAPSTIKKKKKNDPLVDSRVMRDSVTFKKFR